MNFKSNLLKIFKVLGKFKFYFTQGHSTYFMYPLSLINFSVIFYNFLLKDAGWIPKQYNTFTIFCAMFLSLFIPSCIILGYFDCKYGIFRSVCLEARKVNPTTVAIFKRLDLLVKQIEDK